MNVLALSRDILTGVAAENKPRIFQDGRDMVINVALIVVIMLVAVGFTGMCSFNPGAPENGPVQEVDAESFMNLESRAVSYPVRYPQMPEGWTTNSARRSMIDGQPAPVVGWVTPAGGFISLTQTGASLEDAVVGVDRAPRELSRTVDVDGTEARVYSSESNDVRDLWAVDLGEERLLLSGAGTDEEFREVIATAVATEPLSRG